MDELLYTVAEVAKILKVNKHSVYSLISHGHLKALKLGNLKVTRAEILRFLDQNTGKDLTDLDDVKELVV